jgi:hypothetical protein
MKKLLIPFILTIAVLFQSCTGPEGPQGPAGLDGLVGQTAEIGNVNFNTANGWEVRRTFNSVNLGFVESDVILVYILWDSPNNTPIWRLVPQAIDAPKGIFYNFDFTPGDFTLFIDGPSNLLASLSADFTQNQTFRIVAIPSEFNSRKSGPAVDYNDYEAVKKYYNLDESKVVKVQAN